MNPGPQSRSDNAFTKKYRQKQSEYRANVLKVPCGVGPNKGSKNKYGNMLMDGHKSGLNFISEAAFLFAKQKVLDKQVNNDLTIDEYRLFNNMLSSMPMCFNLFSNLRALLLKDQEATTEIIQSMFRELNWIKKVKYIDVEFIPAPTSEYTDDRTAFDAMILVEDENGKNGLISIETKYTDQLGSNSSSKKTVKDRIIDENKIFDAELVQSLKANGYPQIHRNYLLTYVFAKKKKFKHFANVVISPEGDDLSEIEIDELKKHLLQSSSSIMKISLEKMVERAIDSGNELINEVMIIFKERYILV